MNRRIPASILIVGVSLVFLSVSGLASPRRQGSRLTVSKAVEQLALGMGAASDEAREFLNEESSGFKSRAAAVKDVVSRFPSDSDVARRLVELVSAAGPEGCSFSATLVTSRYPAWVSEVLKRYPEAMRCPELDSAVARIPDWAEAPGVSREAELFALDVITAMKHAVNVDGARKSCRYLQKGPMNVRIAAADLIATARPSKGLNCLVKAFDREKNGDNKVLAGEYLDAIARFGSESAFPHLLAAFENSGHFEKACSVVVRSGDDGLKTLVRAVRVSSGRSRSLMECLSAHASVAKPYILPLLDDRSRDIRKFALDFFTRNHFPEALDHFKAGFRKNDITVKPPIPRLDLFEAMASYPVEDIADMVLLALSDNDDRIRDRGLELIGNRKSLAFAEAVRAVAETDPNRVSRTFALGILWFLGDFEAEPLVRRMAQYEETGIAIEAARILGYIGSRDSVDVLRKLAKKYRGEPRGLMALKSLAMLGITVDPLRGGFAGPVERKLRKTDDSVVCGAFKAGRLGREGPLVLAIPGGPGMDSAWARPWMDGLAKYATVAYVDPVDPENRDEVVLTAQDFDCFVESLGHEKAVMVSDGIGGTLVQWLAFQVPARVAGLVTISSPIPGNVSGLDELMVRSQPRPFDSLVGELIEKSERFRREALDYYLLKAAAPGLAGDMDSVDEVLGLRFDTVRLRAARRELSRPEVRFIPMEVDRPALWILPGELMTPEEMAPYHDLVSGRPDKYRIFKTDDSCGVMPESGCGKKMMKLIRQFLKKM